MNTKKTGKRSLYYDAVLKLLDDDIRPELGSTRSLYAFNFVRRELARLAALNDYEPFLPENLAALHPDAQPTTGTALAGDALRAAVAHEGKLLDEIEAATDARLQPRERKVTETSTALPEGLTPQSLQSYLRKAFDPAISVTALRVLSGGRSKQTILVVVKDGAGKEAERIIRRDLSTSPTGSTVADEYELLRILSDSGVQVPRPLHCEPDTGKFGWPFIIVDKVNGALSGHIYDPPGRTGVLDSARALGRLHAISAAKVAPTIPAPRNVAPDRAALRALLASMQDTWNQRAREPSVSIDAAFAWMNANIEQLNPLVSVVHGDYSYHNILFDSDNLSAILDWELARIGHPAEDLGYVRPAALKSVAWEDFMAAYREGGGPDITPVEVVFYTLLEKLRLLIMMFKARDFVDNGLTDDIEFIDAFVISMPRVVHQASVEVRKVMGIS